MRRRATHEQEPGPPRDERMGGVVVSGARWCAALDGTRVAGVGLTQSGARGDAIRGMAERASERFHRRLVVVPISGDAANLSTDRRQRIGAGLEIRDGVIEVAS